MRALRWIALGVGALALVAAALVAYFAITFDPKAYTARVAEIVKRETGRTLTVDGPVRLAVFPKLGVSVGRLTVSEPNGPTVFARVNEARVAVALLPLLSGRIVADRLILDGLSVDLVRGKDGHTNFDDLGGRVGRAPGAAESPGAASHGLPLPIDVGGVEIRGASIGWRDERDGTNLRLSDVDATTGRLAAGASGTLALAARVRGVQPAADLRVEVGAAYRLDPEAGTLALSAVKAKAAGQAAPLGELSARVASETVAVDSRTGRVVATRLEVAAKTAAGLEAQITVPRLALASDRVESAAIAATIALAAPRGISVKLGTAPLALVGGSGELSRVSIEFSASLADLSVRGALATPLRVDLDRQRAELPAMAGELTVTGKGLPGPARGTIRGSSRADWGARSASADVAVALDGAHIDAKAAVARWDHPDVRFSVAADRLDVDRYFPPATSAPAAGGGASRGESPSPAQPPETPIDLSPLRGVTASGTVKVGALKMSNVKAEQVSLALRAAGGVVHVGPIAAALYQGALAGTAVVDANDSRVATTQRLTGVSMSPFLHDLAGHDLLEGRGDISFDVAAAGHTMSALKRGLGGTAAITVKDGAIKGVDVPAIVGAAQALLGDKRALEQPTRAGARTPFTELAATFQIQRGVAHNEDLRVTSPLFRITGRGDVDVAAGAVDYTTKATFTASPGVVGKDLARLAGVTVPIRTTGPLANPTYTVDVAGLAVGTARDLLGRELQRQLGGDKPGEPRAGGSVGDLLRDLIGGGKRRPAK